MRSSRPRAEEKHRGNVFAQRFAQARGVRFQWSTRRCHSLLFVSERVLSRVLGEHFGCYVPFVPRGWHFEKSGDMIGALAPANAPTARLFTMIVKGEVTLIASAQTVYELADKLQKPSFELPAEFILKFVDLIANSEIVAIRGLDMRCKEDADDNMFIETAFNGRADFLITYDGHLQTELVRYDLAKRGCAIVTTGEFFAATSSTRARLALRVSLQKVKQRSMTRSRAFTMAATNRQSPSSPVTCGRSRC